MTEEFMLTSVSQLLKSNGKAKARISKLTFYIPAIAFVNIF